MTDPRVSVIVSFLNAEPDNGRQAEVEGSAGTKASNGSSAARRPLASDSA
jgi:hypothetical protein